MPIAFLAFAEKQVANGDENLSGLGAGAGSCRATARIIFIEEREAAALALPCPISQAALLENHALKFPLTSPEGNWLDVSVCAVVCGLNCVLSPCSLWLGRAAS
jgi:hypothetical protein